MNGNLPNPDIWVKFLAGQPALRIKAFHVADEVFVVVAIGPPERTPCTGTVPEAIKRHRNLKGSVESPVQELGIISLFSVETKVYRRERMEPMSGVEPLTY